MTDLVKRARTYANDPMWADHCEVSKAFMHKMADEIERRVSVELLNIERETGDRLRAENDRLRGALMFVVREAEEQPHGIVTALEQCRVRALKALEDK